ncbi:MAG: hypothetical protein WC222_11420 [Parachlamydiales bacterium]|jgi:hypothetical protein
MSITQQQLDYLCINQQSSIGSRTVRLVELARTGDISAPALAANIMASHGLMKAIKDFDVTTDELTDAEMFSAQEKLWQLERSPESYY